MGGCAITDKIRVVQVVRRFGHVGGMESYAWKLSASLAALGHEVTVLCESESSEPLPPGVSMQTLGAVWPYKPSWLAALRYSMRVNRWLQENRGDWVIHSHVRCGNHNVMTLHGPLFAAVRKKPFWKRMSLRVFMQLWLEKRDLLARSVCALVPCSPFIGNLVREYYPHAEHSLVQPIPPAVSTEFVNVHRDHVPSGGGVVAFIGYEWKRKGLKKAIKIMEELSKIRPHCKFIVAGPEKDGILGLFSDISFDFELRGNCHIPELMKDVDVVLHPAVMEPYGMVITEALASGIRVIVSDCCGAAQEVSFPDGIVLPLEVENHVWARKIDELLSLTTDKPTYNRSWEDVAREYSALYLKIWKRACQVNNGERQL